MSSSYAAIATSPVVSVSIGKDQPLPRNALSAGCAMFASAYVLHLSADKHVGRATHNWRATARHITQPQRWSATDEHGDAALGKGCGRMWSGDRGHRTSMHISSDRGG